jgi:signal transduction histidine kinase
MFIRAAHIMRASSDLDGVIILDASVAATRQRHHGGGGGETDQDSDDESAAESSFSKTSSASEEEGLHRHIDETLPRSSNNSKKTCQILGISTREICGVAGGSAEAEHGSFQEKDLTRLFRKFPNGKILQFGPNGEPTSSAEDSDLSSSGAQSATSPATEEKRLDRRSPVAGSFEAITKMLPQARSVAFVPFWDFERSRWFAGCLCYSNKGERVLTPQLDLAYFKIFSSSIMSEIARLDAMASSQAKTTFVASISHELRSPLHGILGTLQFMQDSSLDSFQVTMLNSMAACGQTLLDTLNHVLDYAKVNEAKRNISTKRLKDSNTVRLSSKPLKNRSTQASTSQATSFDLGIASEEVVEAVFAGQSYTAISGNKADGSWSPSGMSDSTSPRSETSYIDQPRNRKSCYIVLDMEHEQDWHFCIPPGSFRRVLMNIFGNALKYTESGLIHVSLRVVHRRKGATSPSHIVLTVTDTGSGMSPSFLANRVFAPFSQENPHAPGTGLGLSE